MKNTHHDSRTRLERDSERKRAERATIKKHGLRMLPVYLTTEEFTAFQAKAKRERWNIALSAASRCEEIEVNGRTDLTSLLDGAKKRDVSKSRIQTPKIAEVGDEKQLTFC